MFLAVAPADPRACDPLHGLVDVRWINAREIIGCNNADVRAHLGNGLVRTIGGHDHFLEDIGLGKCGQQNSAEDDAGDKSKHVTDLLKKRQHTSFKDAQGCSLQKF